MATINAIYSGTLALAAAATDTVDLPATVVINKSFAVFSGGACGGARPEHDWWTCEFLDTDTLEFNRDSTRAGATVTWFVVEFATGVATEHISYTQASSPNLDPQYARIATAGTKDHRNGFPVWSIMSIDSQFRGQNCNLRWASDDYVEVIHGENDTGVATVELTLIEYTTATDFYCVPCGALMTDFGGYDVGDLYETVDAGEDAKAFCIGGHAQAGGGTAHGPDIGSARFEITDSGTTITHSVGATSESVIARAMAYQFEDGTVVHQMTHSLTGTTLNQDNDFTSATFTVADSIIINSCHGSTGWGESDDATNHEWSDTIGDFDIVDTNTISFDRDEADTVTAQWTIFVIDFNGAT